MFNFPFFNLKKERKIEPTVLVILDGFGLAPPSAGNAITLAKTPHYDFFRQHYPNGSILASGEAVGLPTGEVGNTEVGHLTLGAGRVILQDLKRINQSIENGRFYDNKALVAAAAHAKANKSKLHILGLVSTGKVHSSIDHLNALLQFCKKEDLTEVYIHVFTDGRDAPPKTGLEVVQNLQKHLDVLRVGKIASVSGRYYAMDRDRRWPRIEKEYKAIVQGSGIFAPSAHDAIANAYAKDQTDEFIEPTLITDKNGPIATIGDNDAVIYFNYRIDRAKQLTMALVLPDFENLKTFDFGYDAKTNRKIGEVDLGQTFHRAKVVKNLFFVTMTQYQENLPVSGIAFGSEVVDRSLPGVLSEHGLSHIHMSESEKERFVTYYFDGMNDQKQKGEETNIVPSPKVATYDLKPEMSLSTLFAQFKQELDRDIYHFFVINFANADMVGHTGNLKATIKAVDTIDIYLNDLVQSVLSANGTIIITADHGNAEELLTFPNQTYFVTTQEGVVSTDHSSNPVPVLFVANQLYDVKGELPKGQLSDVAPTILHLMGLPVPEVMTGRNLLEGILK